MPNLKDIRKRITSVKSTQQITKAMKMVAAAKLRKATEAALEARAYSVAIDELFCSMIASMDDAGSHPLIAERTEVRHAAVVLLGSDRGLCGSFNSGLFRKVERFIWEERDRFKNLEQVSLFTFGKKPREYFSHRGYAIERAQIGIEPIQFFETSQSLGRDLMRRYRDGELDRVYVAYNVFQSALTQHPTVTQLFPLGKKLEEKGAPDLEVATELAEHTYEPDQASVLDRLLPKYLDTVIFQAFLETEAGQHGSRMTAMDAATRNAGDMIDNLTLLYNRARQAAITKELVEIVSGAEAL